jgi:penicillin-binding protein 1C
LKNTFDAASIYLTYESLKKVNRPQGDELGVFLTILNKYKTGTSFGFRDDGLLVQPKIRFVGVCR